MQKIGRQEIVIWSLAGTVGLVALLSVWQISQHQEAVQRLTDRLWRVQSSDLSPVQMERQQLCPVAMDSGLTLCFSPGWSAINLQSQPTTARWSYQFETSTARELRLVINSQRLLNQLSITDILREYGYSLSDLQRQEKVRIVDKNGIILTLQDAYIAALFDDDHSINHSMKYSAKNLNEAERNGFESLLQTLTLGEPTIIANDMKSLSLELQAFNNSTQQILATVSISADDIVQQRYAIDGRILPHTLVEDSNSSESSDSASYALALPMTTDQGLIGPYVIDWTAILYTGEVVSSKQEFTLPSTQTTESQQE